MSAKFDLELNPERVFEFLLDNRNLNRWILGGDHLRVGSAQDLSVELKVGQSLPLHVDLFGQSWDVSATVTRLEPSTTLEVLLQAHGLELLFSICVKSSSGSRVNLSYDVCQFPDWAARVGGAFAFQHLVANPQARRLKAVLLASLNDEDIKKNIS